MAGLREHPGLKGDAAKRWRDYVEHAKRDPEKAKRNDDALELHRKITVRRSNGKSGS